MNYFRRSRLQFVAISFVFLFSIFSLKAQDTSRYSVKMAESIISRSSSGYGSWDYVTGTVLRGMEEVWRITGDETYYNYIKKTVDNVISSDGTISGYTLSDYNIDEIKEGCQLLLLYKQTGEEKYKTAAETLRLQLENHPRTTRGGFWHKQRYTNQMWLDGLYMGSPFYAEYSELFSDEAGLDDVVLQITEVDTHTYDESAKLHYHGWDEAKTQSWADPVTGCSESFWGRAIGWYAMAIVDVLDYLPQDHAGRDTVLGIFNRLAEGIALYQDADTLVWWQVVDRGRDENNYIESSASCMFTYALAKGVRLGYIDESYKQVAIDGFQGIIDNFITKNSDGTITLEQTCSSAGLSSDRDGSYEYYTQQAGYRSNDGKGLAPFMLAALEIEMMDSVYPPGNLYADSLDKDGVYLSWFDNSQNETGFVLEKSINGGSFEKIADLAADATRYTDTSLVSLASYVYRIMAVNAIDSSVYSNETSITVPNLSGVPGKATDPQPADEEAQVSLSTILQWEEGELSDSSRVYFGTTNPPPYILTTTGTSFDPDTIYYDSTYYWHIDPVNEYGVTSGDLWTFYARQTGKLVGYWNFSEESGSIIADSSGFANDGEWQNMDESNRVFGYRDQSLYFNGSDQYVEIPHDDVFNFSDGSFTICFYLKQPSSDISTNKEFRYVIKGSHTQSTSAGTSGNRYEIFSDADEGDFRFVIDDNSNKTALRYNVLSSVMTDDWVHIATVRDTDKDKLFLYIDGELIDSVADITGDISQDENLYFGYAPEKGAYLNGKLDEVRFYSYALDSNAIKAIMEAPINDVQVQDNLNDENIFHIFPNPATNTVTIDIEGGFQNASVELVDLCGKTILQKQLSSDNNQLDLGEIDKAVYLLKFEIGNKVIVQKLLVQ